MRTLLIQPHDPVIFRDGKPFNEGALHAKSLPFPLPATIAGAIRTRARADWDFRDQTHIDRIRAIRHTGPFLVVQNEQGRWELALPAPADVVITEEDNILRAHPLRPKQLDPLEGFLSPFGFDQPVGVTPLMGAPGVKPAAKLPPFWRWDRMSQWLAGSQLTGVLTRGTLGYIALPEQKRIHVAIDPATQTAAEGMLFATHGLEFVRRGILSRVEESEDASWPAVAPIGGERRLAFWSELGEEEFTWPSMPSLPKGSTTIRLVLATPAAFDGGWYPAWARDELVPGFADVKLKLVAAAVPRFQPVSGWDLQIDKAKATRFLAPAGSVYFFNVKEGDPSKLWLKSISDREQDRNDGFGIALVGAA